MPGYCLGCIKKINSLIDIRADSIDSVLYNSLFRLSKRNHKALSSI